MLLIHSEGSDTLGLLEGILNLLLSGNETYQKMSSNFEREQNNRVRNYEYASNRAKRGPVRKMRISHAKKNNLNLTL